MQAGLQSAVPKCGLGVPQLQLAVEVQAASRQYANQQIKWARGVQLFRWLDATRPAEDIVADIQQHLHGELYTGAGAPKTYLAAARRSPVSTF